MSLHESVSTIAPFGTADGSSVGSSPHHPYPGVHCADSYYAPTHAAESAKVFPPPSSQCNLREVSSGIYNPFNEMKAPTLANTAMSAPSSSYENGKPADFSFLQQRSSSTCAQRVNVTPRSSRSNSVVEEADAVKLRSSAANKQVTDLRNNTGKRKMSTGNHTRSPSNIQESSEKNHSTARRQRPRFTPTPQTPPSPSTHTRQSKLLQAKKLPLRLPRPPLALITNPYADLPEHLRRHGLTQDAENFSAAPGITVDYVLQMWVMNASSSGPAGLLDATSTFMDKYGAPVRDQLARAQDTEEGLPRHFRISTDAAQIEGSAAELGVLPTHVMAVHGNGTDDKGILIPCHALMYVLQCVSLPAFAPSTTTLDTDVAPTMTEHTLRVLPLRVPRPKEFASLHRFVYTHDTAALMSDLLPMRTIARYCDQKNSSATVDSLSDTDLLVPITLPDDVTLKLDASAYDALFASPPPMPQPKTVSNHATEALSYLPLQSLFTLAYRIHSAWANGVAIGFLEPSFWGTLDRAWTLVVAALAIKKGRLLDAESRGLNVM